MDAVEALAHYGVKGMKWGVRNDNSVASRSAPSSVTTSTKPARRGSQTIKVKNRAGGRVSTKGGRRNVASDDAVKTAVSLQKAKSSSTKSLSNQELKSAIERMNLEKQFTKLSKDAQRVSIGKRVAQLLVDFAGEKALEEIKKN
jgi:hypothetical protein